MTEINIAQEVIGDALIMYHEARIQYLSAVHGNGDAPPKGEATADLHQAVCNVYLTLQPYSSHPAIRDKWSSAVLWDDGDGPVGIDDLGEAVETYQEVADSGSMGTRSKEQAVPRQLAPEQSLRAGQTLWEIARSLCADIDSKTSEVSKL